MNMCGLKIVILKNYTHIYTHMYENVVIRGAVISVLKSTLKLDRCLNML